MSWKTLFDAARPDEHLSSRQQKRWDELRGAIEGSEPAIFWYAGSGTDMMPLVIDVPNNPAKQRLFPLVEERQRRPLILWMNDYDPYYADFPRARWRPCEHSSNGQLWKRLGANVEKKGRPIDLTFPRDAQRRDDRPVRLRFFHVRVTNDGRAGPRRRPEGGDQYTVVFSPSESEDLLRSLLAPHRLRIEMVALVRQGGLSGQRPAHGFEKPFQQYTGVPRLLGNLAAAVGQVSGYVVDREDWSLEGFREVAIRLDDWGADGARLFVRDGSDLAAAVGLPR
ncbi:MAG TPA: hypothetical protein VND64_30145 [Pirellulales bacterium]|nr:hypothetical protein [Pirellulales bacterium]